ncbi:MAG: hypothetical protein Q9187_005934 [Circinaria calcarea]
MRACITLLIQTLVVFGTLGLAAPIVAPVDEDASGKTSRAKDFPRAVKGNLPAKAAKCVNPPPAGTGGVPHRRPHRRDLDEIGSINPRTVTNLGLWCARNGEVAVEVIITRAIHGIAVPLLLTEARAVVSDTIFRPDNGMIVPDTFDWTAQNRLRIRVWRIKGYVLTWGVLRAALLATYTAMMDNRGGGVAVLKIFQNNVEVARGLIG